MKLLYSFTTPKGMFYIGTSLNQYHVIFDNESLGSYDKAWQAAEDLAGGYTDSVYGISDTSSLGIPEDINEWDRLA